MRVHRALTGTFAAAVLTVAAAGSPPASTAGAALSRWHDGPCGNTEGVTVVVDGTTIGGPTTVRCAVGAQASGWTALVNAGFAVTSVPQFPNAAVCTIDARPAQGYPYCWTTGYWSYWNAPNTNIGTKWKLSTAGAAARVPAIGSVEGWSFTLGQAKAPATGPVFQRVVDVRLSAQDEARLQQIAPLFGTTPDGAFTMGVGVIAFLVTLAPSPPVAANLAPPGTATTRRIVFQPDQTPALDLVKRQFLVDDEGACRLGFSLLSYFAALGGR